MDFYSYKRSIEEICHALSTYQFRECNLFYNEHINQISSVRHVEILDLESADLTGAKLYIFQGLSEINLWDCFGMTDETIIDLCRYRTTPFRKIDLNNKEITDLSLEAIARVGCEKLCLTNNNRITDSGIQGIVNSGICCKLDIKFCRGITDAAFVDAKGLRSIDLSNGPQITDLSKFRECQKLILSEECDIADADLAELCHCTYLRLGYHHRVTKEGIVTLLNYGVLRKLSLTVSDDSDDDEEELRKMFPNVNIHLIP